MDRRIAPPKEWEQLLEALVEPAPDGTCRLFKTKQKALMFAASLGYRLHSRIPVERRGEGIRYDIFDSALDGGFIDALAVAEQGDLHVLSDECDDVRATVFEEYCHAGLTEINRVCFELPGSKLDALIALIDSARFESEAEIPGMDPSVWHALVGE